MALLVSKVDVEPRLELNSNQLILLEELKQWVETEAEFYGRSEKEFLVLFLRSCDFDLELSKKTLNLYYLVRVKCPQYWANRDMNHPAVQFLFKDRLAVMLFNHVVSDYPSIIIMHMAHFGPDSSISGPAGMITTCACDVVAMQTNVQLNGAILICDMKNYPSWMFWRTFWPPLIRDMLNSFLLKCCRSWSDIGKFIPIELLPNEYGGQAGPIQVHEDESIKKLLAMSDYILDDNKYGFQTARKPY